MWVKALMRGFYPILISPGSIHWAGFNPNTTRSSAWKSSLWYQLLYTLSVTARRLLSPLVGLTSVALQWESLSSSSLLWTCRRRRDSTHFPPHRLKTRKREKSLQELLAAACSITLLGEWQGEINGFLVSWLSCIWKVVAWTILICSACRYTEICFEFVFMWRIGRLAKDIF